MKWYKKLYLGETAKKNKNRIIAKIKLRKFQPGVHVIALAKQDGNLLDMIPAYVLLQKHYPTKDLVIIGLAGDRPEALLLVQTIVDEMYQATHGFDVRGFLEGRI